MRAFALVTLLMLTVLPSSGQTLRRSLADLTRESDAVVVGRAVRTESFWTPDSSAILTRVTIAVDEVVAGPQTQETVITVPGGQVGDLLHEVSDMPVFVPDEEVLVFTTRLASGETIVAGGMQGKLEVIRNTQTGERRVLGMEGLLVEKADVPAPAPDPGEAVILGSDESKATLPLGEFVARVKRARVEQ